MDEGVANLLSQLTEVERVAEDVLLIKQKLIENDRQRNFTREALTALRRSARSRASSTLPSPSPSPSHSPSPDPSPNPSSPSPPLIVDLSLPSSPCSFCGAGSTPGFEPEMLWMAVGGGSGFVEAPQKRVEERLKRKLMELDKAAEDLREEQKAKVLALSNKGGLEGKIGPGVLKSLVTLRDKGNSLK